MGRVLGIAEGVEDSERCAVVHDDGAKILLRLVVVVVVVVCLL